MCAILIALHDGVFFVFTPRLSTQIMDYLRIDKKAVHFSNSTYLHDQSHKRTMPNQIVHKCKRSRAFFPLVSGHKNREQQWQRHFVRSGLKNRFKNVKWKKIYIPNKFDPSSDKMYANSSLINLKKSTAWFRWRMKFEFNWQHYRYL